MQGELRAGERGGGYGTVANPCRYDLRSQRLPDLPLSLYMSVGHVPSIFIACIRNFCDVICRTTVLVHAGVHCRSLTS